MAVAADSELVVRALGGDASAFGELHGRHARRARMLALAIVGDQAEAEDVAQDAVLAAFVELRRLRDPERFGGWLYAIAVNLARMRLRSRRQIPSNTLLQGIGAGPELALEQAERDWLVRDALRALPAGERDVVVRHYFEGLSCREIATALGLSPGAVRVRLHRARARLRNELAHLRRKEAAAMAEVLIEDVIVRSQDEPMRVVLLRERDGDRRLPIWIGAGEGDALAVHLGGETFPRPVTTDLAARLLEAAGARIEQVTVSRLAEKTFYAVVTVAGAGGSSEIDARPSDALNLAARVGAPVYVADEVLVQAGIKGDDLQGELDEIERTFDPEREPTGEWRSLSAQEVKEAWLARAPK